MKERRSGLRSTRLKIALSLGLIVLLVPLVWPERARIPVEGATPRDWNKKSFWYEPWGESGVHKGIDIFAPAGRPVVAAVLGPKCRIHYFAHLRDSKVRLFELVGRGEVIGTVGNSGNAAGKGRIFTTPFFSSSRRCGKQRAARRAGSACSSSTRARSSAELRHEARRK